jgi:DNA end-binding protein Ku
MRSIWKGSISFGLVTIPVALYPGAKHEELKFRLLRDSDLSPVRYKRVSEVDDEEVPWEHIVKGFEYERGKFIPLKEEDFKRVDVESTQMVEILEFTSLDEIDPRYFYKPYFIEPQKGGAKAYALLRDVLKQTGLVGIAKVVIKTRQYLAAVKPEKTALLLELMHFHNELVEPSHLDIPAEKQASKKEIEMAKALVESMTSKWEPEKYVDEYSDALLHLIEEKVRSGGKLPALKGAPKKPTNVIDLVSVLQKSLDESKKSHHKHDGHKREKRHTKKAA